MPVQEPEPEEDLEVEEVVEKPKEVYVEQKPTFEQKSDDEGN